MEHFRNYFLFITFIFCVCIFTSLLQWYKEFKADPHQSFLSTFDRAQRLFTTSSIYSFENSNDQKINIIEPFDINRRVLTTPNDESNSDKAPDALPIIYTFYDRIDTQKHMKYTGMTDSADRLFLQHWKRYWTQAGWDARVLTLDDARGHPDYERFDRALNVETLPLGYFDKLLFFKWLAMASVGGGFYADYDVLPIRKITFDGSHLPNDGKLTIYDETLNGAFPCLVSGSGDEYGRLSKLLLETTVRKAHNVPDWNELSAVFEIYRADSNAFVTRRGVLQGEKALSSDRQFSKNEQCWQMAASHWAVHFSHASMQQAIANGYMVGSMPFVERPKIAEGFLNQWLNKCEFVFEELFNLDEALE